MTQEKILNLAYHGALLLWSEQQKKQIEYIAENGKISERIDLKKKEYWKELEEIEKMLIDITSKVIERSNNHV